MCSAYFSSHRFHVLFLKSVLWKGIFTVFLLELQQRKWGDIFGFRNEWTHSHPLLLWKQRASYAHRCCIYSPFGLALVLDGEPADSQTASLWFTKARDKSLQRKLTFTVKTVRFSSPFVLRFSIETMAWVFDSFFHQQYHAIYFNNFRKA